MFGYVLCDSTAISGLVILPLFSTLQSLCVQLVCGRQTLSCLFNCRFHVKTSSQTRRKALFSALFARRETARIDSSEDQKPTRARAPL